MVSGVASTHFKIFGNVYTTKRIDNETRKREDGTKTKTTSHPGNGTRWEATDRPNEYG